VSNFQKTNKTPQKISKANQNYSVISSAYRFQSHQTKSPLLTRAPQIHYRIKKATTFQSLEASELRKPIWVSWIQLNYTAIKQEFVCFFQGVESSEVILSDPLVVPRMVAFGSGQNFFTVSDRSAESRASRETQDFSEFREREW